MEVSFSRGETLKRGIISEFKIVDFKYFLFSFVIFFSFIFILGLRVRVNVTSLSHISHMIMCHIKEYGRFWKDDVIQACLIHIDLKANIWLFRVG